MIQSILEQNMESIKTLCHKHHVKELYAFGSVCTDKFNYDSDIDLLISFMPMEYTTYAETYFELADQFEALFHRPVDLVTDKSLSNPYFIESVNKAKVLLYAA